MNRFTEEQIHSISPDAASIKAAQKVFSKTKWEVQKSERAVWSVIQGSGKKPYYTQIDIEEIAFKCSCPSRKFPCKHGLSLGLYLANNDFDKIETIEEPLWLSEWIDKRRKKVIKKAEKPKKIVKPEDVAKKSESSWKEAFKNIEHLELWLKDFINSGLIDMSAKSDVQFTNIIKRMVDYKLPGINTFLREIQNTNFLQKGWEQTVLKQIHLLNILVNSVKHYETLDVDYKKELELLLGWNIKKDELLNDPNTEVIDDVWFVVNVIVNSEDNLVSKKVFLYGFESQRWAYILDFAYGGVGFTENYVKGSKIQAKLAIYPGVHKSRAIIKIKGSNTDKEVNIIPIDSFNEVNNLYLSHKIKFPFTFEMPFLLPEAKIIAQNKEIYLVNEEDEVFECLNIEPEKLYKILSFTKGANFNAFIIMNDYGVNLLSVYCNGEIFSV